MVERINPKDSNWNPINMGRKIGGSIKKNWSKPFNAEPGETIGDRDNEFGPNAGSSSGGYSEAEIATHNTAINREIALLKKKKHLCPSDVKGSILKSKLTSEQQQASVQDQIERLNRMKW